MFYNMWYNAPKLLPAGGLDRGGSEYVFGVKDVAEQHHSHRTHATFFTPNTCNILHTEHMQHSSH